MDQLATFVSTNEAALLSLSILSTLPVAGELISSLIPIFVDIPDPVMEKMEMIQNAISNMQDNMLSEFKNV